MVAGEFVRVASVEDVPPGRLLGVEVGGRRICLANVDGEVYAFQDNCTHRDFPLSAGELEGGALTCAWHGARFDVPSGRVLALPAIRPLKIYEVRVEGSDIYVAAQR
ncbi:MAG: non-heme iron oxygenase ferredoxin subunit [Gemmatimonadetes bacterium]|nr:non-heme iron oxygenase ferredoxin subunit [Gemmatimonadota bacterium]